MRAIQRAIVGVGLAVVALVAMALLIGGIRSIGPDQATQPAQQATGQQTPLADDPTVAAAGGARGDDHLAATPQRGHADAVTIWPSRL